MKKFLFLIVFLFALVANAFSQQYADYQDVVYLKNGGIVRGIIIEQVPQSSLKIETTGGNVFVYTYDEIEKIAKEPKVLQDNERQSQNSVSSTGLKKGYRGIVELGTLIPFGMGVHVINGYQFNPYVSLGAGVGLDVYFDDGLTLPLFADLRINFLDKRVSPYIAFDIGYTFRLTGLDYGNGLLFLPISGARFKLSDKYALNVGLGLGVQGNKSQIYYDYYDLNYYPRSSYTSYDMFMFLNVGFSF